MSSFCSFYNKIKEIKLDKSAVNQLVFCYLCGDSLSSYQAVLELIESLLTFIYTELSVVTRWRGK